MHTSAHLKMVARTWLGARETPPPAQLQRVLEEGTEYLMFTHGRRIAHTAARRAVLEAWSEIAAERCRAYVDLEASTPQLLVLVDEVTKQRRLFPVADLVRILGPRSVAA